MKIMPVVAGLRCRVVLCPRLRDERPWEEQQQNIAGTLWLRCKAFPSPALEIASACRRCLGHEHKVFNGARTGVSECLSLTQDVLELHFYWVEWETAEVPPA